MSENNRSTEESIYFSMKIMDELLAELETKVEDLMNRLHDVQIPIEPAVNQKNAPPVETCFSPLRATLDMYNARLKKINEVVAGIMSRIDL